jgi:hypothetical protein
MRRAVLALTLLAAARPAAAELFDAQVVDAQPTSTAPKLDLLIVVDTSTAAAPLRASLPADVGPFLDEITQNGPISGQLDLDLHVGVITADPADGGALHPAPAGCAGATALPFLRHALDSDGGTTTNYTGRLAHAITCLLPPASATGADAAQPFATIKAALSGGLDPAFRRTDAQLAILVITVQDDCSPLSGAPLDRLACAEQAWSCTPALDATTGPRTCYALGWPPDILGELPVYQAIESVAQPPFVIFGALRGDPYPTAVIGGPALATSCERAGISATPALRVDQLAGAFNYTWKGSACGETGFADFGYVVAEGVYPPPQSPPDNYDCDGGLGYGDRPIGDRALTGCGCRGSSPTPGGLVLVAISLLGLARRSSPSRRCRARRARAAG